MTKEQAYDSLINPLMAQIIAVCKEHKIPMLASFTLCRDDGLHCTTALLDDAWEPSKESVAALRILLGNRAVKPLKITTRDADGEIKSIDVIL